MGGHARLRSYFTYNPADPGRVAPTDPCVVALVDRLAPGSRVRDLGGDVSLNLLLEPADLVLRVHQPFVSRRRVFAVQHLRQRLDAKGLIVPLPVPWEDSPVLHCRQRYAELERRLRHERRTPSMATYRWLFEAVGALHQALASLRLPVPRPVIATYTPPSTLRRWLAALDPAVGDDPESLETVGLLQRILGQVRRR